MSCLCVLANVFAPASLFSLLTISEDIIQGMPNLPKALMESAPILRGTTGAFAMLPYETINYRDNTFPVRCLFARMKDRGTEEDNSLLTGNKIIAYVHFVEEA